MTHSHTLILFLFLLFLSCSSGDKGNEEKLQAQLPTTDTSQTIRTTTQTDKEFEKAWTVFANAISARDLKAITQLSSSCIHCTDCVTNTSKEDSLFNIFQKKNPDTWYDKLYTEFSYVPINKFLRQDFAIIFDSTTRSRMLITSKISYHDDEHNKGLYDKNCIIKDSNLPNPRFLEMFVKIIDFSTETEGFDKAFTFIQTKHGYKFCGYSTIP